MIQYGIDAKNYPVIDVNDPNQNQVIQLPPDRHQGHWLNYPSTSGTSASRTITSTGASPSMCEDRQLFYGSSNMRGASHDFANVTQQSSNQGRCKWE